MKLGLTLLSIGALGTTVFSFVQCADASPAATQPDPVSLAQQARVKSLSTQVVRADGNLDVPEARDAALNLIKLVPRSGFGGSATSACMVFCKYPKFRSLLKTQLPGLFKSYRLETRNAVATIVQVMRIQGFDAEVRATHDALKASDAEIDLLYARFIEERI